MMQSYTELRMFDFNSIKVRLKPKVESVPTRGGCHFNSIKVRLKRHVVAALPMTDGFQFHKGTIKTVG